MAAAAQPQDLGKRQRKKVSYNEANLARDKTSSPSDSDYSGSDAVKDDEDGSSSGLELEGEEGKKVSYPPFQQKKKQPGASTLTSLGSQKHLRQEVLWQRGCRGWRIQLQPRNAGRKGMEEGSRERSGGWLQHRKGL